MLDGRWRLRDACTVHTTPDGTALEVLADGQRQIVRSEWGPLLALLRRPMTPWELRNAAVQFSPTAAREVEPLLVRLAQSGLLERSEERSFGVRSFVLPPWALLRNPVVYAIVFAFSGILFIRQLPELLHLRSYLSRVADLHFLLFAFGAAFLLPLLRESFRALLAEGSLRGAGLRLGLKGFIPVIESRLASHRWSGKGRRWTVLTAGFFFDLGCVNVLLLALPLGQGLPRLAAFAALSASLFIFVCALNPLAKYDGYHLLNALFGVEDVHLLAKRAFALTWRTRRPGNPLALLYPLRALYSVLVSAAIGLLAYTLVRKGLTQPVLVAALAAFGALALMARRVWWPLLRLDTPEPEPFRWDERLQPVTTTLVPSVSSSEGVALGLVFVAGYDAEAYHFDRLAPALRLGILPKDSLSHARAAAERLARVPCVLDDGCEELAREGYRSSFVTLSPEEQATVFVARRLREEGWVSPEHRFVPAVDLYDGVEEFGLLDNVARLSAFTLPRLLRYFATPLLPPNRFRVESFVGAFVRRETQHVEALLLAPREDDSTTPRRIARLRTLLERDRSTAAPLPRPAQNAIGEALAELARRAPRLDFDLLAALRGCDPAFLQQYGVIPAFSLDLFEGLDAKTRETLAHIELLKEEGGTLQPNVPGPAFLVPVGPHGTPTGAKARLIAPKTFFEEAEANVPSTRRFRFYFPREQRSNAFRPRNTLRELPTWFALEPGCPDLFFFEGEMKAMAFHQQMKKSALSTSGLFFNIFVGVADALAAQSEVRRCYLCFDAESPQYREGRLDGQADAWIRALQLGELLRSRAGKEVFLVHGLERAGKKLDFDGLFALAKEEREAMLATFRSNIAQATPLDALLSRENLGEYVRHLNSFAFDFYALLEQRYAPRSGAERPEAGRLFAKQLERLYASWLEIAELARRLGPDLPALARA